MIQWVDFGVGVVSGMASIIFYNKWFVPSWKKFTKWRKKNKFHFFLLCFGLTCALILASIFTLSLLEMINLKPWYSAR